MISKGELLAIDKNLLDEINNELVYEYNVSVPPCFLNGDSDVKAFIDLEELFQANFSFSNPKISKLSYLFKFKKEDLISFDKKYEEAYEKEIKSWGFGYALKSSDGKAAPKWLYYKLVEFFKENVEINMKQNLFKNAKAVQNKNLEGIGEDYLTDFILIMKEKEIKLFSLKIYEEISKKFETYSEIIIKNLKKMYCWREELDFFDNENKIFPYLIPLEIIDSSVPNLSSEFRNRAIKKFYKKLIDEKDKFALSCSEEVWKLHIEENFISVKSEYGIRWRKFYNELKNKEISKLNSYKLSFNFDDYTNLKNRSKWEIDFLLNDLKVLNKLNLRRSSLFIKKKGFLSIIKFYFRKDEAFIFISNINKQEILNFYFEFKKQVKRKNTKLNIVITKTPFNKNFSKKNDDLMNKNLNFIFLNNFSSDKNIKLDNQKFIYDFSI